MHKFEENNFAALFSQRHQCPPRVSQRDSFQTLLSVPLSVRCRALILLPKCLLFKAKTSLSPLFISRHLSLPELLYFMTLHSEFQAQINSLDTKAAPALSVWH